MSLTSSASSPIHPPDAGADHAPGERLPAGLVYVSADMPGWTRVRTSTGFCYQRQDGSALTSADDIARIHTLAIPPAYEDVWICPLPNGHLQATGRDARGRLQYRYHPDWRRVRDDSKFARMLAFGQALPRIRRRVAHDLQPRRGQPLARSAVLAAVVRLLDTTYLRVGNAQYAVANRSYGLTTLQNRHADVRGSTLRLHFRGKSGVEQNAALDDPRVARIVRRCQQLPGQELFQYQAEDGTRHSIGSADVNQYLQEISALRRTRGKGAPAPGAAAADAAPADAAPADAAAADGAATDGAAHFTAKDFRTWHGTAQALELTRLACHTPPGTPPGTQRQMVTAKSILEEVARQLGNTPAVCKKSYVHPAVLALGSRLSSDAGPDMQRIWQRIGGAATPRGLSAAERRLLAFLRKPPKPLPSATPKRRATRQPARRPQSAAR